MQYNKIIELEGRIFLALKNLKILKACGNEIKYISSKISECLILEELYLDDNKIEILPTEVTLITSLRIISISSN